MRACAGRTARPSSASRGEKESCVSSGRSEVEGTSPADCGVRSGARVVQRASASTYPGSRDVIASVSSGPYSSTVRRRLRPRPAACGREGPGLRRRSRPSADARGPPSFRPLAFALDLVKLGLEILGGQHRAHASRLAASERNVSGHEALAGGSARGLRRARALLRPTIEASGPACPKVRRRGGALGGAFLTARRPVGAPSRSRPEGGPEPRAGARTRISSATRCSRDWIAARRPA